jgi:hypothetical protein
MGDFRLSALNLNWFFRSSVVPCPKTTLGTHLDKQSLGCEMLQIVRTLMPGFPFADYAEGTRFDRETIPRKERQNFNSKQRVKVPNRRRTCKTLQSLIYFIKINDYGG